MTNVGIIFGYAKLTLCRHPEPHARHPELDSGSLIWYITLATSLHGAEM